MSLSRDNEQDPDYVSSETNVERQRELHEENARSNTAKKIVAIVEKEFAEEIDSKEKEVLEIQERLHKALKTLHLLRYAIITDFYNRKQCQLPQPGNSVKQTRIHPAIKQLIGKAPKHYNPGDAIASTSTDPRFLGTSNEQINEKEQIRDEESRLENSNDAKNRCEKRHMETAGPQPKKIPRYIPPKNDTSSLKLPSRGERHKVRKRIVVGNISKWIPPEWREDVASHKWTMYVRGDKEDADIAGFVAKVRFFLHPSFKPNDVVEISSPPFHLSRRGWGEFPLRVQLHFRNTTNKPMDIIHHLKLDKTYTGLQTLGSETVVDIWLYTTELIGNPEHPANSVSTPFNCTKKETEEETSEIQIPTNEIKSEPEEVFEDCSILEYSKASSPSIKIEPCEKDHYQILSHIFSDHDYLASEDNPFVKFSKSNSEKNVTIDHTSDAQQENRINGIDTSQPLEKSVVEREENTVTENSIKNVMQVANRSCRLPLENYNGLLQHENISNGSLAKSNLQERTKNPESCKSPYMKPLKISIPSNFEPTKAGKQVLVLTNNKFVPVNVSGTKKETSNVQQSHSKIPAGVSLLKKPMGQKPSASSKSSSLAIKPANSLLLNSNYNIPALRIADSRDFGQFPTPTRLENENPRVNCSEVKQKVIVGKDRHKVVSKKDVYESALRTIENVKIADTEGLLRFIIRRFPLISKDALDSDYKKIHPYASRSEEEWFGLNIGKQRAYEWCRAKRVRDMMKRKGIKDDELWTVKEILLWARLHGYTPIKTPFTISPQKSTEKTPENSTNVLSTYTESTVLQDWLKTFQETKDSSHDTDEEEIDVVYVSEESSKKCIKKELQDSENTNPCIAMELPSSISPQYAFVSETARDIGIQLKAEEIIPGVMHCTAGRLMLRAMECFLEDLTRSALAKSFERSRGNQYPDTLTLDDVRGALMSREEFDLFTNVGLGSTVQEEENDEIWRRNS